MPEIPDPSSKKTPHQREPFDEELRRRKYDQLSRLVTKWMADESGYDERVLPILLKELNEDSVNPELIHTVSHEPSA